MVSGAFVSYQSVGHLVKPVGLEVAEAVVLKLAPHIQAGLLSHCGGLERKTAERPTERQTDRQTDS